jgi:hypothetical protein
MNQISQGFFDDKDFKGNRHPRAGQRLRSKGWRGACCLLKGDWEFLANVVKLQRWDEDEM